MAKFNTLSSLSLLFADVTDEALQHLDRLANLESLTLPDSTRDESLAALPVLASLESLILNRAYVTDASIKHIAKHPKLESISLEYTAITEEGIAKLHTALPGCHVNSNPFSKYHDMKLFVERIEAARAEEHRVVGVSSPYFHDADCELLSKLDRIEGLFFSGAWITGSALSYVKSPEALKELSLDGCPLTEEGFERIRQFSGLRSLNLNGTWLDTETAIDLLKHLPKLEKLELMNCPVGNAIVPAIMGHPMLTEVWLEGTNVELRQNEIERLYQQKPDLLFVL